MLLTRAVVYCTSVGDLPVHQGCWFNIFSVSCKDGIGYMQLIATMYDCYFRIQLWCPSLWISKKVYLGALSWSLMATVADYKYSATIYSYWISCSCRIWCCKPENIFLELSNSSPSLDRAPEGAPPDLVVFSKSVGVLIGNDCYASSPSVQACKQTIWSIRSWSNRRSHLTLKPFHHQLNNLYKKTLTNHGCICGWIVI